MLSVRFRFVDLRSPSDTRWLFRADLRLIYRCLLNFMLSVIITRWIDSSQGTPTLSWNNLSVDADLTARASVRLIRAAAFFSRASSLAFMAQLLPLSHVRMNGTTAFMNGKVLQGKAGLA